MKHAIQKHTRRTRGLKLLPWPTINDDSGIVVMRKWTFNLVKTGAVLAPRISIKTEIQTLAELFSRINTSTPVTL